MSVPPAPPAAAIIREDVRRALAEDFGDGDATADLLPADARATARIVCREDAVIAGIPWAEACFRALDASVRIDWRCADGERVGADATLCELAGRARTLVGGERCALNFLQTLSATATVTARYVAAVAGTRATILDTRKTLPGLRLAQKYAVRCGGGSNHRIGLFDAILIKENHIAAAGGLDAAVRAARAAHPRLLLEVEVESLQELDEALAAGVDRVMLDDFTPEMLRAAVGRAGGRVPLEVSGGVDLERVRAIAECGVDFISIGALTKHVHAIDLSMRIGALAPA
ncbi:MAG: carboxylating nicotinate-nucleotide diphosphorylase [Mizugakiibacter sp.]|uniref:carboxylating nicotinate-nucleotide diphosphorylase n=1 Tax=Mizugakiibacter sp. TaxID=1972610 RepID=UPI0031C8D812|nr:carboxylating nicotinate-nucleotide diphosphorylase [Xanthomonadaceae bacterium]